ncbi:MAG: tRNA (cytidine(34)-2'-O)-methyltransferase [Burkholderiales bacterium]
MFDVVLYQPEIPPNTGNVLRLCANAGCRLHLVRPLGFRLDDRALRRAGLDYATVRNAALHDGWGAACAHFADRRIFAFSARAQRPFSDARFERGDVLLFGPETRGLPAEVLDALPAQRRLLIPMRPGMRSINLSNAVALAVYEAWRQTGYAGAAGV